MSSADSSLKGSESTAAPSLPPRHWVGLEELSPNYWSDAQVREQRGQEFLNKPIETLAALDASSQGGMARREFLTLMGASMAMASMACARRPVHKIIPYVVQPQEVTPGIATWYASTCAETGVGILVKTREGRPIKLEGNPDHPLSRGALSSRGQAGVLSLYDPDRLKEPLARDRANPTDSRQLSWEQADQAIAERLKKLPKQRVRVLAGAITSPATRKLVGEFVASFAQGKLVEYAPLAQPDLLRSQQQAYGTAVVPAYRFALADVVVSIGSDFMNDGLAPLEHLSDWSKRRKLRSANAASAKMSEFFVFEGGFSLTGANADERTPIRPGDELKIAAAIAHELIVGRKLSRFAGDAEVTRALASYKPAQVAQEIGLKDGARVIERAASALWTNRGRGLVIAGATASRSADELSVQLIVNLLNSACDNEGVTVDGTLNPDVRPQPAPEGISDLMVEMASGQVDALIVFGPSGSCNPVYTHPRGELFAQALKKVPLVVTLAEHDDETGLVSDFVLPTHHYLENWGDAHPRAQLWSLQQPAMGAIWNTRAAEDSLIALARASGVRAAGGLARSLTQAAGSDAASWHEYLKSTWAETLHRDLGGAAPFALFWEGALRRGIVDGISARGWSGKTPQARPLRSAALAVVPAYKPAQAGSVRLSLYASSAQGEGRLANNAWLQELPDPVSTVTWDNFLAVGPALAKRLALANNDVVELTAGSQKVELPVLVQPGLHPEAVSAAIGYGRARAGRVGTGVGINLFPLAEATHPRLITSGMSVSLRKTGRFYKLAETQWHHVSENRPILNDITLAQFRANPAEENHTNPHLRLKEIPTLWPRHEYKNYRWGMAIDLNACTGCGACIIGCQAENNTPTVGRDNVRISREMHWIRIDRYYSGDAAQPNVLFQPMLCQHCENAPCETVCPVLATVHDDEGMNSMIYNRCVGTRYCQNNCPYKVRRFNFFDHWKSYEGVQNLVWNPEVAVRSRGVMEKCTFCVQRIIDGKHHAKDRGEKVRDLEIQTACQQACPTEAITFGNINDSESLVSRLQAEKHAFRSLEILNTRPAISYLSKVRNQAAPAAGSHSGQGGAH